MYYGEYRANREGSPVHVWASRDQGATWEAIHRFSDVRHIHGVFADPYDEALWITTGDSDRAAGIWRTRDRFATVERVAGGSQQTRAVQLLFTRAHVYFGSDAPAGVNHIYRLRRADHAIERLQQVEGPVYYGCRAGGRLFFSTACEPPALPRTREVAVWSSADGEQWRQVAAFRKDPWPARIFQHGHVLFPAGRRRSRRRLVDAGGRLRRPAQREDRFPSGAVRTRAASGARPPPGGARLRSGGPSREPELLAACGETHVSAETGEAQFSRWGSG